MTTQRCGSCKQELPLEGFSPFYRGKTGRWCRSCLAADKRGERQIGTHEPQRCAQCGETYIPKQLKQSASFCSRGCKDDAKNARTAQRFLEAKPRVRYCLHCSEVIGQERRKDAVFCSERCNFAAHAMQRKYRARTGDQSKMGWIRAEICERDRWRCGICGGQVSQALRHPDPLAASLDHIVPVSEGGGNEATNLRLTHLRCNLSRRNRGGYEQLSIV